MNAAHANTGRLLIACSDARGIVAAVAGFLAEHNGNLLESDQHTDTEHGEFFMRAEFELDHFTIDRGGFYERWQSVVDQFSLKWNVYWGDRRKRMAIMVGSQPHCLLDLVWRWQAGELEADIACVISNHAVLRTMTEQAGLSFFHCPIHNNDKESQEKQILQHLADHKVDVVVLARYMQIVSPSFIAQYPDRIINIHHSFLPAFAGGDPYRQAYDRGVKLIGATSHYVTSDLDAGPIIAQDVTHVSHRDAVDDLKRKGRDLERIVLARAVRAHLEDKVLVSQNKTVVFE